MDQKEIKEEEIEKESIENETGSKFIKWNNNINK